MAYLSKDDYSFRIQRRHLDDILNQAVEQTDSFSADDALSSAELTAQAEIRAFLIDVYKIDEEFAKTGSARNKLIMKCYIDIALYHLHMSITPQDIPETRYMAYEKCSELLDQMRREEINPGIDLNDDDDLTRKTKIITNTKFIFHPHDDSSLS